MGEQSNGRFAMRNRNSITATRSICITDINKLFYFKKSWRLAGAGDSEFVIPTNHVMSDLRPKIQALFLAWYPTNMHIVQAFFDWSMYLKVKGKRDYYSSQMIVHKLRWESAINSDFDQYKINQNLGSALGRVVMALDPRLEGMFRVQKHSEENKYE